MVPLIDEKRLLGPHLDSFHLNIRPLSTIEKSIINSTVADGQCSPECPYQMVYELDNPRAVQRSCLARITLVLSTFFLLMIINLSISVPFALFTSDGRPELVDELRLAVFDSFAVAFFGIVWNFGVLDTALLPLKAVFLECLCWTYCECLPAYILGAYIQCRINGMSRLR